MEIPSKGIKAAVHLNKIPRSKVYKDKQGNDTINIFIGMKNNPTTTVTHYVKIDNYVYQPGKN
jgi:hypothetical protein